MRIEREVLQTDERPLREGGVALATYVYYTIVMIAAAVLCYFLLGFLLQLLRSLFMSLLTMSVFPGAKTPVNPALPFLTVWFAAAPLIFVVGAVGIMVNSYAKAYSHGYMLTNRRLVVRSGVFHREISSAEIERLQDVLVRQSFAARLFGYGTVTIETAGTLGLLQLHDVAAPHDWVDAINRTTRERAAGSPVRPSGDAVGYVPSFSATAVAPPGDLAAAWHPDPLGRHQTRYWDGHNWSAHVADSGRPALDPIA